VPELRVSTSSRVLLAGYTIAFPLRGLHLRVTPRVENTDEFGFVLPKWIIYKFWLFNYLSL
jgi:hypothetical protein